MKVSVIIPTYNEAEHIGRLVRHLVENGSSQLAEIIVVDGNSEDCTIEKATTAGAATIIAPERGRGSQLNAGAERAKGDILYFVHADTFPPADYLVQVVGALSAGYPAGCFPFRFDSGHRLLRINAFFTHFNRLWCRGGDQSLYVTKDLFKQLGGFRSDYRIMEDFDFIQRIHKSASFRVMPATITVSARKYVENGYFRVQIANLLVFTMFRFGASQDRMIRTYRLLLEGVSTE